MKKLGKGIKTRGAKVGGGKVYSKVKMKQALPKFKIHKVKA